MVAFGLYGRNSLRRVLEILQRDLSQGDVINRQFNVYVDQMSSFYDNYRFSGF